MVRSWRWFFDSFLDFFLAVIFLIKIVFVCILKKFVSNFCRVLYVYKTCFTDTLYFLEVC